MIDLDISFGVHGEHLLFCAPNKRGQYEVRYASSKSFREGEYIGNGIFTVPSKDYLLVEHDTSY